MVLAQGHVRSVAHEMDDDGPRRRTRGDLAGTTTAAIAAGTAATTAAGIASAAGATTATGAATAGATAGTATAATAAGIGAAPSVAGRMGATARLSGVSASAADAGLIAPPGSAIWRAGVGRTWSSPTWSGPDGSSHNDFAAGRSGSHLRHHRGSPLRSSPYRVDTSLRRCNKAGRRLFRYACETSPDAT